VILAGMLTVLVLGAGAYLAITMLGNDESGRHERRTLTRVAETHIVAVASDATRGSASSPSTRRSPARARRRRRRSPYRPMPQGRGDGRLASITSTPRRTRVHRRRGRRHHAAQAPGTPDRHTTGSCSPHELYVAQVDGHGAFAIPLKEVT
jgi:hypothetical protein